MLLTNLFSPAIVVMSSMKYPKKLALATAVFFIPFVLFLYIGYEHLEDEVYSINKLQTGLSYQQTVRRFFEYIPLERGMAVAFKQGDSSYKPKIEKNFKKIEEAIHVIDSMPPPNKSVAAEWTIIKNEWRGLQEKIWEQSALENYRSHTVLIDKILLLMQHIGAASYEINDADLSIYNLVRILSDNIPALIQYTGQGRALGVGIILKKSISFDEQKEATILYGRIRSNLNDLIRSSNIAYERHNEMFRTIIPFISAVESDIEKFSEVFTTQILNTDSWNIEPNSYFENTTHTIDTYFKAYDAVASSLQSHLNARLANLHHQVIVWLLIASLVLAGIIYFTVGFYLAFIGVLNELTSAARLISSGKYVAHIPIKTSDEMADVSHAFNDMAKKIKQSFALLESYKKAVDSSNILSITDINGNITYVNDQFCLASGYSREELIGKNHRILKDSQTPEHVYRNLWETIVDKKIWSGVLGNVSKNKSVRALDSTIIPILDEAGEIVEFVATRHDITELVSQRKQLIRLLYLDSLTQLPNRTKLLEDLALTKEPVLILVNINHFGEINDFYGTDIGDTVLIDMRDRIASGFSISGYTHYRIYADEFALLCEKTSLQGHPHEEIIVSLQKHIESIPFYINESTVFIKVTIAAVMNSTGKTETASNLLTDVDMALRHAKQQEKEFIILDDIASIRQEIAYNIECVDKIRAAITTNRIVPFFQGIVDNDSIHSITKYECLIRLIEPDGKTLPPYLFLDVAKKAKIYPQLTMIMIEKAFSFFQKSTDEFSINLSVEDILDQSMVQFILEKMKLYEINNRVIFEILESEGFENFDEVQEFIGKVKQLGGRIAIDDFGSGYSNFAYIMHLQVDFIKIDASLIKNIDKDSNSRIIVETIVAFAKRLGIKTVAEFVHSKEVFEVVRDIGVDFSQGFYFHEPIEKPTNY